MHPRMGRLLAAAQLEEGSDGIWSGRMPAQASDQSVERVLRERVAAERYDNYLAAIAHSHSIPVMDHEVRRFLTQVPPDALVLDIGGCWGWHWRRLLELRPDVGIVVIDFVRGNLMHAKQVLGSLVGGQVALVHADAGALPFPTAAMPDAGFDAVWTVQVLQHIPDFARAVREAHRVLLPGGRFANYSLHITPLIRFVCRLFGKPYHIDGLVNGQFHLTRADEAQRSVVERMFGAPVTDRYTECLFHPELALAFVGRAGSWLGRLDARLSEYAWLGRWAGRQRSFEVVKA